MKNPVGWFEVYVDNLERARAFYQAVFQVTLEALPDPTGSNVKMLAFPSNMEAYGATGALVKMEGMSAGGNSTLVYFACDDCAVEEKRVKEAGGQIQTPKMSIGDYGFISLVVDTEGNMIGLHSSA